MSGRWAHSSAPGLQAQLSPHSKDRLRVRNQAQGLENLQTEPTFIWIRTTNLSPRKSCSWAGEEMTCTYAKGTLPRLGFFTYAPSHHDGLWCGGWLRTSDISQILNVNGLMMFVYFAWAGSYVLPFNLPPLAPHLVSLPIFIYPFQCHALHDFSPPSYPFLPPPFFTQPNPRWCPCILSFSFAALRNAAGHLSYVICIVSHIPWQSVVYNTYIQRFLWN